MWGVLRVEGEELKGLDSKNSILMGEIGVYFLCLDFIEGFGGWVQET